MSEQTQSTIEKMKEHFMSALRNKIEQFNGVFNKMPMRIQHLALLTTGIGIATLCTILISDGFHPVGQTQLSIDSITNPTIQPMEKKSDTTELIPLGKLKGEINGEFTAFYVAMDRKGNFFRNDNPTYSKDRWVKTEDWKQMTYRDFMQYEKQLHFQPLESKSKKLKR